MNKQPIIQEIETSLKILNENNPFSHFDIKLSHKEINHLNNIHISIPKVYDNFGNLDNLSDELTNFIKSLNQNNNEALSKSISILIKKLVVNVLLALKKETAWVTVRASIATDLWDIPRWHTDGYYYSPYIGEQYKVVITLKGPTSLFYPLPRDLREKFYSLQFDPKNRETIANMLDPSQSISSLPPQGTIYIVGTNYSAVHSEPPIHEERLFLSIVPGSKPEIQQLHDNWYASKKGF